MVTDGILCAVEGIINLLDTPERKDIGNMFWNMLSDFDEDNWDDLIDSGLTTEWLKQYIKKGDSFDGGETIKRI